MNLSLCKRTLCMSIGSDWMWLRRKKREKKRKMKWLLSHLPLYLDTNLFFLSSSFFFFCFFLFFYANDVTRHKLIPFWRNRRWSHNICKNDQSSLMMSRKSVTLTRDNCFNICIKCCNLSILLSNWTTRLHHCQVITRFHSKPKWLRSLYLSIPLFPVINWKSRNIHICMCYYTIKCISYRYKCQKGLISSLLFLTYKV